MEFNLKNVREKKGYSQTKLAEVSGVSRVTINRIENGELQHITSDTLIKLSEALKTTTDSILKV